MGFFSNLFKSKEQKAKEKKDALKQQLDLQASLIKTESYLQLVKREKALPIVMARDKLRTTLRHFTDERNRLNNAWDTAYENFSWWNKLKHNEKLDLRVLDRQITDIENALQRFNAVYSDDLVKIKAHFRQLDEAATLRIATARDRLKERVENEKLHSVSRTSVASAWLAGLSIPVSTADNLYEADDVFDALRTVNGNFENMSNTEIWLETLWMSPESLTGLASLTKGAYFEQLVATDTGGELFENFNNADTDITIDGIEYQIKATESVGYINSVDDDIPVITTSEVAAQSQAIDSGYSNEEIANSVDLAIGGTVIDAQDSAIDAILTGVGSLGLFATLKGISHAQIQYERGIKREEALAAGLGVAIEGTAKGLVDASEMVYNVATSRPMRFIGRGLFKVLTRLDKKFTQ